MEPITIKFEPEFLKEIERIMRKNHYATKAEFIREAVREKVKDLEKETLLEKVKKLYGSSKRKTSDEDLHKAGEKVFEELKKQFK